MNEENKLNDNMGGITNVEEGEFVPYAKSASPKEELSNGGITSVEEGKVDPNNMASIVDAMIEEMADQNSSMNRTNDSTNHK